MIHTHYCKLAGRKSKENEVFPVYSTKYANQNMAQALFTY